MTVKTKIENFKIARFRKGFSLKALSRAAGLCVTTVYKIEHNEVIPTAQSAKKLCDALQVDFEEIFEIVNDKKEAS